MRKTKTSESSPIRVDFVPAHALRLPGRLGMTFAPGKKIDGLQAVWDRDLATDLKRLRGTYETDVIVSLIESHELELLRTPDLFGQVEAAGMRSVHAPIVDGSVPRSMTVLRDLVHRVIGHLAEGLNVVIHCRGGLGRTGLVAAACLVARGVLPENAVRFVRTSREYTIETAEQENCVGKFAAAMEAKGWQHQFPDPARHNVSDPSKPTYSKIVGCLMGGALGDALGYPIEFDRPASAIQERYGQVPPTRLDYTHAGEAFVSDDTQMTLFTAEGVIRLLQCLSAGARVSMTWNIEESLLRWYATQIHESPEAAVAASRNRPWLSQEHAGWLVREARLFARRAPGNTCLSALQAASQAREGCAIAPNNSKGCGGVMRSAPIGLGGLTRELAFKTARDSARFTHGHPSGYLSSGYFASVIFDVSRGMTLAEAITYADRLLAEEPGNEETVRAVAMGRDAAARGTPDASTIESLGGGWVGEEALAIALLCVLTADSSCPEGIAQALWRAVAHSGDSDSTGSITGNLLGAMRGMEALPAEWVAKGELRDIIERIADDLYGSVVLGNRLDKACYPSNYP